MRGFQFNISSLFNYKGTNNIFNSINFSDYASIKNGSYRKLVKTYYGEQKKTASSSDTTSKKTQNTGKKQVVDQTGLTQMKKEADGLQAAAEALEKDALWKQTGGKYDMEQITQAVTTFAKEYNETIDQAGKVNSKEIAQEVKYMGSMTSTMSKALSKIGIEVGFDGKLTVDEEQLKNANVKNIKALFTGKVSYGSEIADKAGEIAKDAVMHASIYGSNGMLANTMTSDFNQWG